MIPTILTAVPFSTDWNLGRACNEVMALLPESGWACLMDHDVMFTTSRWHAQLLDAIERAPRGAFTGVTNRIWSPWQQAAEAAKLGDDIALHRKVGEARLANKTLRDVTDWRPGWGGMLTLISKEAWRDAGGHADGMECVDHLMHRALASAGRRIYCIEGLYVYHWRNSRFRKFGPWADGCCKPRPRC